MITVEFGPEVLLVMALAVHIFNGLELNE